MKQTDTKSSDYLHDACERQKIIYYVSLTKSTYLYCTVIQVAGNVNYGSLFKMCIESE